MKPPEGPPTANDPSPLQVTSPSGSRVYCSYPLQAALLALMRARGWHFG
jgi:hypothetical protein